MSVRPHWQIYVLAFSYPVITIAFHGIFAMFQFLPWVFTLAILITFYGWSRFPGAPSAASPLLTSSSETPPKGKAWGWFISGFFFVVSAVIFLEMRQPFYFTQDDGVAQFLPGILQGMHSLDQGVFPTWNPYQFMGSPTTTVGTYALTYPPTYLAYWISKVLLGNENLTLEVFSAFHLLGGYAATFWAIRREHVRPSLAMLGGLCSALSGYALIVGRSWFYMTPMFLWVPLLVGLLRSAIERPPDWKWIAAFGLTLGFFFHAGNVQMWAYAVLLLAIAISILLVTGSMPRRRMLALAAAGLLGVALAAPLLIPEMLAVQGVKRIMTDGGILTGLPTLFFPVSIIHTQHPLGWGGLTQASVGEMYYSGTLFCVVGFFMLLTLIGLRWTREIVKNNVWFLCALLALIFALGNDGILWSLLWKVPLFDKFRLSFKFLGLFDIFMAIAGAAALERLLRRWRWRLRGELALAAVVLALLAYHLTLSTGSFFEFGFRPYPSPDPHLRELLRPGGNRDYPRIFTLSYWRSASPDWVDSMTQQWPTIFGFFSFGGYDLLADHVPDYEHMKSMTVDPEAFRRFGIRYIVVDKSSPLFERQQRLAGLLSGAKSKSNESSLAVYQSSQIAVFKIAETDAMAFEESLPNAPLPVTFDGAGATIDSSGITGNTIILNMLRRPEIRAKAGSLDLRVDKDRWDRIRIHLPASTSQIRVDFSPPWEKGFAGAAVLLLGCLTLTTLYMRLPTKAPGAPGPTTRLTPDTERDGHGITVYAGRE